ncbi:DUF4381 domain-containing protein [uncultured Stenotrophomonas sp.]|uniref:DUF4381 domain-containing protein n=1 Tax=uncultured Stenotrophomonas sp. TaxID=165438 RepID=UPI0025EF2331|nr:DUF4381 domain-containing protein [uncultured Stenotrophomonas sp.]
MAAQLPLRDVHLPAAPGWWPLAPGWWLLIGAVVLVAVAVLAVYFIRRRRLQRWMALFDRQLQAAPQGPAKLAAASELLRRAARRLDPQAAQLQGDAWLRFLDGPKGNDFSGGDGHLLLDGGFRPQLEVAQVERTCQLARSRFLQLMAGRR